jgi:hypothetical protein
LAGDRIGETGGPRGGTRGRGFVAVAVVAFRDDAVGDRSLEGEAGGPETRGSFAGGTGALRTGEAGGDTGDAGAAGGAGAGAGDESDGDDGNLDSGRCFSSSSTSFLTHCASFSFCSRRASRSALRSETSFLRSAHWQEDGSGAVGLLGLVAAAAISGDSAAWMSLSEDMNLSSRFCILTL